MALRAKRKSTRPDEFVTGVPNQDLDEETYRSLTNEQREAVRVSELWDVRTDAEMAGPAPRPAGKDDE